MALSHISSHLQKGKMKKFKSCWVAFVGKKGRKQSMKEKGGKIRLMAEDLLCGVACTHGAVCLLAWFVSSIAKPGPGLALAV